MEEDLRRFPGITDTHDEILRRWLSADELRRHGVTPTERFELIEEG